jgi:hypothetical protein
VVDGIACWLSLGVLEVGIDKVRYKNLLLSEGERECRAVYAVGFARLLDVIR